MGNVSSGYVEVSRVRTAMSDLHEMGARVRYLTIPSGWWSMPLGTVSRSGDVESALLAGFDFVVSPVSSKSLRRPNRVVGMVDVCGAKSTPDLADILNKTAALVNGSVKHLVFVPPLWVFGDSNQFKEALELPNCVCTVIVCIPLVDDGQYWQFWNDVLQLPGVSCALYFVPGLLVPALVLLRYATLPVTYLEIDPAHPPPAAYIRAFAMPSPPAIVLANSDDCDRSILLLLVPGAHIDTIIEPLDPLGEDLAIDIYGQFEQDTKKYERYREAIAVALRGHEIVSVLVVGPGKGPLVQLVVETGATAITAVEKNHLCKPILEEKNHQDWGNRVQLVYADAREIKGSWNLVVSEMLGSFGCNELSPEVLASFDCPLIPQSYTSYIRPIYSPMIPLERKDEFLAKFSVCYLLAPRQKCWTYRHPGGIASNVSASITFIPEYEEWINAFEGTFMAQLYANVMISNFEGEDDCVTSWFPMVFPVEKTRLKRDMYTLTIGRCVQQGRVRYRWEFLGKVYGAM